MDDGIHEWNCAIKIEERKTMDKCTCTSCKGCGGTGNVWFSMTGEYIGNHHWDDLDELETCEECHGTGIDEICDYCRELEEEYEAEEFEQYRNTRA